MSERYGEGEGGALQRTLCVWVGHNPQASVCVCACACGLCERHRKEWQKIVHTDSTPPKALGSHKRL